LNYIYFQYLASCKKSCKT